MNDDALRLPPPIKFTQADSDYFTIAANRPSARKLVRQIREAFGALVAACEGDIVEAATLAADAMNDAADAARADHEIDGTPGTVAFPGDDDDCDGSDTAWGSDDDGETEFGVKPR
jgi:hypothetical protein